MNETKPPSAQAAQQICIFLASLTGGGAEAVLVTLANGFVAHGRQVTVVVGDSSGPLRDQVDSRIEVIDLSRNLTFLTLPGLIAVLRRREPDTLLSGLHVANLVALLASGLARQRLPVVVSEHSSVARILDSRSAWRRFALRNAMRALYPRAARVVTVSQGAATELSVILAAAPTTVQAIPNPIDIGKVRACAEESTAAPSDLPLVLGVGRLAPEKRFEDLIQAFADLREKVPCRLEILGEGAERPRLEALCERMGLAGLVSMPGFTRNPFCAMRQAAVLVVTSDREGFGNVIVEAMALGTPVVSTDCPFGPREILDHGRWGRLVPVGDREALADAVIESLRSPPVAAESLMARAEMFDKHHAIEAYLSLLDEIVFRCRQSR